VIKKINPTNNSIRYFDLPENDPKLRRPDINLAIKLLSWEPKVSLEEGLIKTFDYYIKTF